ncbi:U1 [Hyposoter didymator ichnovirus]|nr:U1 [Hyposoter didymator ichnovirus]
MSHIPVWSAPYLNVAGTRTQKGMHTQALLKTYDEHIRKHSLRYTTELCIPCAHNTIRDERGDLQCYKALVVPTKRRFYVSVNCSSCHRCLLLLGRACSNPSCSAEIRKHSL